MARVVVLDYGSGNLRSAERALRRVGADVEVTADHQAALECDGLVVPGVGAFAACMAGLRSVKGDRIIGQRLAGGRPVLGVCVGMQILFDLGIEHGVRTEGCGEWPGTVERLDAEIVPHMGWNTVRAPADSVLFDGLDASTRFYFVHSYAPEPTDDVVATCDYGGPVTAAVVRGRLWATQFHPEKSGDAGAHLLTNWLKNL